MSQVWVIRCGVVPYGEAREAQRRLESARQAGEVPDLLLLLEHPPVYTRGRRADAAELPMGVEWYETQGIEVCDTDRGGRVTYHGPGQLVAYPIVDLRELGRRGPPGSGAEDVPRGDVVDYVRRIERVMIAALGDHDVAAATIDGLTGVWTAGAEPILEGTDAASIAADVAAGRVRKIGSIGIHVSRGVTTHGLAVNVNNDLQPFEWIVPCGIDGCRMTSLTRELGEMQDLGEFASTISRRFGQFYEREPVAITPTELAAEVDGTSALTQDAAAGAVR